MSNKKETEKTKETTSKNINEIFGNQVRQLRLAKGLSQEELGLQCGLHRTYIGQIERAEKNITLQSIYRIATTLDMELREIFDLPELYKTNSSKKYTSNEEQ